MKAIQYTNNDVPFTQVKVYLTDSWSANPRLWTTDLDIQTFM